MEEGVQELPYSQEPRPRAGYPLLAYAVLLVLGLTQVNAAEGTRVVLENGIARFELQRPHMGLVALLDKGTGVDHMKPPEQLVPRLWSISFRTAPGAEKETTLANTDAPATSHAVGTLDGGGTRATLRWDGLGVGDEQGVVDVRVTIELPRDSGIAAWRIWVANRSRTQGLWKVSFPSFTGYLESGKYDVAAPTCNWGLLMRSLASPLNLPYPHGYSMTMQFLCAMKGKSAVYMATHDPGAWLKTFVLSPGESFGITTPVENMGVPGSDFAAPFPAMVGVYRGNWMEACKTYRAFVAGAPWTAGGRLKPRDGGGPSIADVALWMRVGDEAPDESHKLLLRARTFLDVPLGVHWYNWHSNAFDDSLPDYLPAKPKCAAHWGELARDGFVVMPYINGRLASTTARDFPAYAPSLCRDRHGKVCEQKFGADMDHPVCPSARLWHDKMLEITEGITNLGANTVYFDQISGELPILCFDRSHGHPLGGGGWWVDGYRQLLTKAKQKTRRSGRNVWFTGEFPAEPYMGTLDGFLVWTTRLQTSIPMLTAVYSGYTNYFGTNTFFNYPDRAWIMREGRDFLWGSQNGWMHPAQVLAPEHAKKALFLKQIGQLRVVGRQYLSYGELVALVDHPRQTVTEEWPSHGAGKVTLPAIQGTIWKAQDGSLGVLLVNYDNQERTIPLVLDTAKHSLATGPQGRYRVARFGSSGKRQDSSAATTALFRRTETLAAWEARLLVLSK